MKLNFHVHTCIGLMCYATERHRRNRRNRKARNLWVGSNKVPVFAMTRKKVNKISQEINNKSFQNTHVTSLTLFDSSHNDDISLPRYMRAYLIIHAQLNMILRLQDMIHHQRTKRRSRSFLNTFEPRSSKLTPLIC